jgi:hypothetical protein
MTITLLTHLDFLGVLAAEALAATYLIWHFFGAQKNRAGQCGSTGRACPASKLRQNRSAKIGL